MGPSFSANKRHEQTLSEKEETPPNDSDNQYREEEEEMKLHREDKMKTKIHCPSLSQFHFIVVRYFWHVTIVFGTEPGDRHINYTPDLIKRGIFNIILYNSELLSVKIRRELHSHFKSPSWNLFSLLEWIVVEFVDTLSIINNK